ncbi:hypothetical protein WAI453_011282 [Rhynchosporium graminicola]
MVGTSKWMPEWIYFVWESNNAGKKPNQIVVDLDVRFPRSGKAFNTGGVRYVLANYPDPTRFPLSQVMSGGIEKMKKPAQASQASPRMAGAIHKDLVGSSAIPVGPSYNLESQTYPSIKTVTGGPQSFKFYPGQMNMHPSTTSSTQHTMSHLPTCGVNYSLSIPRSHAHPEQSFNGRKQGQYPTATYSGENANDPMYIDGDGDGDEIRPKDMERTSSRQNNLAGYGQKQFSPYMMGNDGRGQHVHQQQGSSQAISARMQPPMDPNMSQFIEIQAQQVMGGFNSQNVGQVGLGQGVPFNSNRGIMQGASSQFHAPNAFQVPQQYQKVPHDISATKSSARLDFGGSIDKVPGPNHGLQKVSGNASSGHGHTQTDRPLHQIPPGGQFSQGMMGHSKDLLKKNNVPAVVAGSIARAEPPTKPSGVQTSQTSPTLKLAPSFTISSLNEDDFELVEADNAGENAQLLDLLAESLINTAPILRPDSYSKVEAPAYQPGMKRKHQEDELSHIGLSGAPAHLSNVDRQMSPNKRHKRDELKQVDVSGVGLQGNNAAVTGQTSTKGAFSNVGNYYNTLQKHSTQRSQDPAQQPNPTIRPQSQPQASQNRPNVSQKPELINLFNMQSSTPPDYDVKLLQEFRKLHGGRSPEQEMQRLFDLVQHTKMNNKDGKLSSEQENGAKIHGNQIKYKASQLLRSSSNTPQNPKQLQENGPKSGGCANGLPQSAMSLTKQRMQHKFMQEKIAQSRNEGNSGASALKPSGAFKQLYHQQEALSNGSEKEKTITQSPQHQASPNTNTTGAPPAYQAATYLKGAVLPNSQSRPQSKAPPTSQPTLGMSQSATSKPPQSGASANGTGAIYRHQAPTNVNWQISTPQQAQYKYNGNGASNKQAPKGDLHNPNMARPNTAPSSTSYEAYDPLYLVNYFNYKQSPPAIQSSAVHPSPNSNARPSMGMPGQIQQQSPAGVAHMSGSMQPPPFQQPYHRQQAPDVPVNTSSTGQGLYQSPYQQNGQIGPHSAPYQYPRNSNSRPAPRKKMHTQPKLQAAKAAGAGRPFKAPEQKANKPNSASNTSNSRENTSSPETVSPNTTASSVLPFANANDVTMLHLQGPIFHQHFTFPTTHDGWSTMMDHLNSDYTVSKIGTVIIMNKPQFLGGVTWPHDKVPPPPPALIPPQTTSGSNLPMPPVYSQHLYTAPIPAVATVPLPAPSTIPLPTTSGLTLPIPPGFSQKTHVAPVPAFVPAPSKSSVPQSARQPSYPAKILPSPSTAKVTKLNVHNQAALPKVDQKKGTSNTNNSQPSFLKPVLSVEVDGQKQVDSQNACSKTSVCDADSSENIEQLPMELHVDEEDDYDELFDGPLDDLDEVVGDGDNLSGGDPNDESSASVPLGDPPAEPPTDSILPTPSPKLDQQKQDTQVNTQDPTPKAHTGDRKMSFEERMEQVLGAAVSRMDNDDQEYHYDEELWMDPPYDVFGNRDQDVFDFGLQ